MPNTAPTAIVTGGAGSGIGMGITEALLRVGWSVLVVDEDRESLREMESVTGGRVETLEIDITRPNAAESIVAQALACFGRLDGLVNNAGIGLCKSITETSDDEFERLLNVDFRAPFRLCRAAILELAKSRGAIVNIGSIHAHQTIPGYTLYAAIKAGIEGFTRGLAVECGGGGIRVNCVHPGLVMSRQNHDLIARFASDSDAWVHSYVTTKQLLPELVTRRQVGEIVAMLLGPTGSGITGQAITVDGGTSAMLFERAAQA